MYFCQHYSNPSKTKKKHSHHLQNTVAPLLEKLELLRVFHIIFNKESRSELVPRGLETSCRSEFLK